MINAIARPPPRENKIGTTLKSFGISPRAEHRPDGEKYNRCNPHLFFLSVCRCSLLRPDGRRPVVQKNEFRFSLSQPVFERLPTLVPLKPTDAAVFAGIHRLVALVHLPEHALEQHVRRIFLHLVMRIFLQAQLTRTGK